MAINYFHENRKKIQRALYDSGFIKVHKNANYTVEETQLKSGEGKLKSVQLLNVPLNAWIVDLEIENNSPFAIAGKVPEKAIIFHTNNSLYVLMIELKNRLSHRKTKESQEKFENAIRKLAVLLPIHIYDSSFDNVAHKYFSIIAYNDSSPLEINLRIDDTKAREYAVCRAFQTTPKRDIINIDDDELGRYKLDLAFYQNPNTTASPESMEIDLTLFFSGYPEFATATSNVKTCPKI